MEKQIYNCIGMMAEVQQEINKFYTSPSSKFQRSKRMLGEHASQINGLEHNEGFVSIEQCLVPK